MNIKNRNYQIDNDDFVCQIWDTQSLDRAQLSNSICKGAHLLVLVIDLTNQESLQRIWFWIELIREAITERIPVFILGNKCDSPDRSIRNSKVKEFVSRYNLQGYIEVSASSGRNIDKSLQILIDIASKRLLNPSETTIVEHVYSYNESSNVDNDKRETKSEGLIPEAKRNSNRSLESFLTHSTNSTERQNQKNSRQSVNNNIQATPVIDNDIQKRCICGWFYAFMRFNS